MKKLPITILFFCVYMATYAQDTTKIKQKPKTIYQVGKAKVIVWENKDKNDSIKKSFQVLKN